MNMPVTEALPEPGATTGATMITPARLPAPKSFDEILQELTDQKALVRHTAMMAAYDAACHALLTDADVQVEGKKTFKKKSAWRKLAQFFRVTVEIVRTDRWWESDEDGQRHLVARAICRGTAPWGQSMDAVGLCSTRESRFYASGVTCPNCGGPMWDNRKGNKSRNGEDFRCKDNACGGELFPVDYNPEDLKRQPNMVARAKADHDCEATAATRATNRAISDLIAAGEASAEEMEGAEDHGAGTSSTPASLLERKAFGKDWKGKTWQQVLDAGPDGESFVDWVVKNADRMSVEDKQELARALAAKRQKLPPDVEAASEAQGPPQASAGGRTAEHQKAMTFVADNAKQFPKAVEYIGEAFTTDDVREWIRKHWAVLHQPTEEAATAAIECAAFMNAYLKNTGQQRVGFYYGADDPDPLPEKPAKDLEHNERVAGRGKKGPDRIISEAQRKRLIAIALNEGGFTMAGLKLLAAEAKHELEDIPVSLYDELVEKARNGDLAERFNTYAEQDEQEYTR
jgi:hypothetical protein